MYKARTLILVMLQLLATFLLSAVWADDMRALNTKKDELELEKEVEDMERYGEAASQVETERETARLRRETRQLEAEIDRARNMSKKAVKRAKVLAGLYQKKARLAAAVEKQARRAESNKARTEKVVVRLDQKVKAKESVAILAVQRRKDAEAELGQMNRDQKTLQRRLRVAEETIKRNEKIRKTARGKSIRLSQTQNQLKLKVGQAEARAARL